MRFAALNERAKIRDEDRPCDMTINIVTHLARLPGQQASPSVGNPSRSWRLDLLSQQCGCFKQCVLCRVCLVVKLTNSCLKERNHPVHPFARSRRTGFRYCQRLFEVTIDYQCLPHSSSDRFAVLEEKRYRHSTCT